MKISFNCPKCHKVYSVESHLSGRRAKCQCGAVMVISQATTAGPHSSGGGSGPLAGSPIESASSTRGADTELRPDKRAEQGPSQESACQESPTNAHPSEPVPWYLTTLLILYCAATAFVTILAIVKIPSLLRIMSKQPSLGTVLATVIGWLLPTSLSAPVTIGLWRRSRLARQWIRFVSLVAIIVGGAALCIFAITWMSAPWALGDILRVLAKSWPFFLAIFSLFAMDTRRSRRLFGLLCPQCGSYKVRGVGLRFKRMRCKECGATSLGK